VRFHILGPLSVVDGDRELQLGGVKQRSLLALLLLHRNETISTDRLIDELWGERPPDTAAKTVQVYVSRLRRALGDGRIERADTVTRFASQRMSSMQIGSRRSWRVPRRRSRPKRLQRFVRRCRCSAVSPVPGNVSR
jgi:hypothetical protein